MLAQILAHSIDYPLGGPVFPVPANQDKEAKCSFFPLHFTNPFHFERTGTIYISA